MHGRHDGGGQDGTPFRQETVLRFAVLPLLSPVLLLAAVVSFVVAAIAVAAVVLVSPYRSASGTACGSPPPTG